MILDFYPNSEQWGEGGSGIQVRQGEHQKHAKGNSHSEKFMFFFPIFILLFIPQIFIEYLISAWRYLQVKGTTLSSRCLYSKVG